MAKLSNSFNVTLIVFLLLTFNSAVTRAETLYVSDELRIPLRSGDTSGHRIIKFLKSGTRVEVQDTNEAGSHHLVTTETGKQGWVEVKDLMSSAAARNQLPALNKRIATLNVELKEKSKSITKLQAEIRQLKEQNTTLDKTGQQTNHELAQLKKLAARPVQLAQQNNKLETDLAKANRQLDAALAENARLGESSLKEWFMIGAGVSLISLFFGLIIPNFRWRRKKDSWGGGF